MISSERWIYSIQKSWHENKNVIVSDFSTVSPKESVYCYQKFKENNILMLSIPVMGGPNAALYGKLIPIVSGEETSFKKIKKY